MKQLLPDLSALRKYPAYRRMFASQVISQIGTQVTMVTVMFQVFKLTDSSLMVGLVGAAQILPLICFGLVGGAIADAMDRRRLLQLVQFGMMLTSGTLALLATGDPPLWSIYALAAVASAFAAIEGPTRSAMAPMLVDESDWNSFVALREFTTQSGRVFGPLVAGVLLATSDIATAYAFDAASFLISIILCNGLPKLVPEFARKFELSSIVESLQFVKSSPILASTFVADIFAMVFGMPRVVFPEFAHHLKIDEFGLGLLYAAIPAGAFIGWFFTGITAQIKREGTTILVAISIWGAAIALVGLTPWFPVILILLAIAGAADMVSAIFRQLVLLQLVPDELRGRLSAVHIMVVTGGPPLGDIEAGVAAELIGVEESFVLGGGACVVAIGLLAAAVPGLRRFERP